MLDVAGFLTFHAPDDLIRENRTRASLRGVRIGEKKHVLAKSAVLPQIAMLPLNILLRLTGKGPLTPLRS